MQINKKLVKFNYTANSNNPVYIVIHDTGNFNKGANAEAHYKYFNGGDRQASAHFFVDDKEVIQIIEVKDSAWHVGDGRNQYGINNKNSIGIELCVNSDGDYNKAFNKLVELTKYLMNFYKIKSDKVVRHYDASRKNCPQTMSPNNWTKWIEFKKKIAGDYSDKIILDNTLLLKKGSKGYTVRLLQKRLTQLGFDLVVDGDFGNMTELMVKEFQRKYKLVVDGIVGKNTINKLNSL